ncbi:DUF7006 family protein [Enterococcus mundtii]|uniref:DUF7006 family protein n=1 Tax=Enterococcus mundtii TaxID=53346 RepID=UPI001376ED52|nr:hypothetical protein [Enterococcus mundtii]NBA63576.1 hypothetical protein [Enterococcus mundtii]
MVLFRTRDDYVRGFQAEFNQKGKLAEEVTVYIHHQLHQLDYLVESITKENFWEVLPQVIGIDAKLMMISDLMELDNLTMKEIIRITENEYHYYLKELCGYDLPAKPKHSIVFNIM